MLIVRKRLSKQTIFAFYSFLLLTNLVSGCTRSHAMFDYRPDTAGLKHMSNLPPYNKLVFIDK